MLMVVGGIMDTCFSLGVLENSMVICRRHRNQDIGLPRLLGFFFGRRTSLRTWLTGWEAVLFFLFVKSLLRTHDMLRLCPIGQFGSVW